MNRRFFVAALLLASINAYAGLDDWLKRLDGGSGKTARDGGTACSDKPAIQRASVHDSEIAHTHWLWRAPAADE